MEYRVEDLHYLLEALALLVLLAVSAAMMRTETAALAPVMLTAALLLPPTIER